MRTYSQTSSKINTINDIESAIRGATAAVCDATYGLAGTISEMQRMRTENQCLIIRRAGEHDRAYAMRIHRAMSQLWGWAGYSSRTGL